MFSHAMRTTLIAIVMFASIIPSHAQFAWGPHISVRTNAVADTAIDSPPCIIAGNTPGVWIAYWIGNYVGPNNGGEVYRSRSTDDGQTWSAPVFVRTGYCNGLRMAKGKNGVIIACWHEAYSVNRIFYSRSTDDGITWTASAQIPGQSGFNYTPALATDGNGVWVVTFESSSGGDYDIVYMRSTDNGVTWSSMASLNSAFFGADGADDRASMPETDGNGNWVVAFWSANTLGGTLPAGKTRVFVSRSTNNGSTWGTPTPLSTQPLADTGGIAGHAGSLCQDGKGNWIYMNHGYAVVPGTGSDTDIFCSRSSDNGVTWSSWQSVNSYATTDSGSDGYPVLVTTKQGRWVACWHCADTLGGTKGADNDILFTQSYDNGATWRPYGFVNPNALTDTGNDVMPGINFSARGTWLAACVTYNMTGTDPDPFVFRGVGDPSIDPGTWDAGIRDIGDGPSAPVSMTLSNDGFSTLTITGASFGGSNPAAFSFGTAPALVAMAASTSQSFSVRFDPSAVGVTSATLTFSTDAANEPTTSVILLGEGTAHPEIDVAGGPLAFGDVPIALGPSGAQSVVIADNGSGPLTFVGAGIQIVGTDAADFVFDPAPPTTPLDAGSTVQVSVRCDPSVTGAKTATLRITTDDADEPTVDIALTATGTDGEVQTSPSIPFGDIDIDAGASAASYALVENLGDAPLHFTGPGVEITGPDALDFSFSEPPTTSPIAVAGSRAIGLQFDPSSTGPKTAYLLVYTNDADEPVSTVNLSGTAVDQEISVAPASIVFGEWDVDDGATTRSVTITNDGSAPLNFTGAGLELAPNTSGSFAFADVVSTAPILVGQSRNVTIAYDPSTTSIVDGQTASLQITTDDTDESVVAVPLSGTAVDQEITVTTSSVSFDLRDIDGGASPSQTFTIRNDGNADLSFTGAFSIVGTDGSCFGFATAPSSAPLGPGATRDISVFFDPATLGTKTASVQILSNDTDEPTVLVGLSGTGVDQEITVSPTAIDFGRTPFSEPTPAVHTITIRNDGTASLNFTGAGISLAGPSAAEFQFSPSPIATPIPPGQTRDIGVIFVPTIFGHKTASVLITTDDTDEPGVSVSLAGFGYQPSAGASDWQLLQ